MIEGAINTETFDQYVDHLLVSVLRARDIVLLDNLKCHYSDRAIDLIEAAGAGVLHAPATRRTLIRLRNVFQRSSRSTLVEGTDEEEAVQRAGRSHQECAPEDILGWFKHCGYIFSLK